MEELERLGELRDKGLLTEEQFDEQRNKLLPLPVKPFSEEKEAAEAPAQVSSKQPPSPGWPKPQKLALGIFTFLSAIAGPVQERLNRENFIEYKTRLSTSEAFFGFDYPEDSMRGWALPLDILFDGLVGFLLGVIFLKLWNRFIA